MMDKTTRLFPGNSETKNLEYNRGYVGIIYKSAKRYEDIYEEEVL